MTNKSIIDVNLDGLPRPLAAAVRYLAEQSWAIPLEMQHVIPLPDAAKMLGVPQSTLNLWCRKGLVKSWKQGKNWRVNVEDARQYLIQKVL